MPDGSVRLSPREAIEKEAEGISQSLILCAHTHIARAVRLGDGRMVVNPGSVGVPGFSYNVPFPHLIEAGTPDARYAILELAGSEWRVTFRHVPYDHAAMAALARRNGYPEFASALATGGFGRADDDQSPLQRAPLRHPSCDQRSAPGALPVSPACDQRSSFAVSAVSPGCLIAE